MFRIPNSHVRFLVYALTLELFLLTSGCKGPTQGPTAPVEFMRERRQWTKGSPDNASSSPASGVNPDAAAIPNDRSAPTRPTTPSP